MSPIIGTITRMEDPRADPWDEIGSRWASLGEKLVARYRDLADEDGPSPDEVRSALRTIGDAAQKVVAGVGSAMQDPDVRNQVKAATGSLVTALSQVLSDLGKELRDEERA